MTDDRAGAPEKRTTVAAVLAALFLTAACDRPETARTPEVSGGDPQAEFWTSVEALCGQAFEGRVVESQAQDTAFVGRTLTMHVRACSEGRIEIPFHVGENRSRTWVLTRSGDGLRLKHDHRHEDGSEDAVTQYGGDTRDAGSATRQEFPADAFTAELLPAAATNVWTVEVDPGRAFAYALRREGTDRRVRIEFDLTRAVPPPPPPWGASAGG